MKSDFFVPLFHAQILFKNGNQPILFPRKTQSDLIPICVDAMRQNGD